MKIFQEAALQLHSWKTIYSDTFGAFFYSLIKRNWLSISTNFPLRWQMVEFALGWYLFRYDINSVVDGNSTINMFPVCRENWFKKTFKSAFLFPYQSQLRIRIEFDLAHKTDWGKQLQQFLFVFDGFPLLSWIGLKIDKLF